MAYKKIKSFQMTEDELRTLWSDTYCSIPVRTFDGITVKFYSEMFDHAFFESFKRKEKDKSILSLNRCEKMLWIKDALEDATTIRKQGWINKTKTYDENRRVTLVKDNYIVIIQLYSKEKARFISAYEINDEENLKLIKDGPDWK